MTIFDSSGIEAFVTENNPKYANRIIRQLKTFAKSRALGKSYDPYKAAYGSMPSHASANPEFKQLYINSHFCYVFGIITNGSGNYSPHFRFTTKIFWLPILRFLYKRNRILQMKIKASMIQGF